MGDGNFTDSYILRLSQGGKTWILEPHRVRPLSSMQKVFLPPRVLHSFRTYSCWCIRHNLHGVYLRNNVNIYKRP